MKVFSRLSFFILTVIPSLQAQSTDVIVFVHGTLKPADFSFGSIVKIMGNNIANTLYSQTTSYIRQDPYFYQAQAMQSLGLHPIPLAPEQKTTAQCIAELFELQYQFHKTPSTQRLYYTFGWNGLLNVQEREKEGEIFYTQLKNELTALKKAGHEPHLHIIGYSHGGNVALNLAPAQDKETDYTQTFSVEKLILLGMPVQKATDYLVTHDMFKKVYHVYSTEDSIQTLDIFGPNQMFSDRIFKPRSGFVLPAKLVQIRIRITRSVKGLHKVTTDNETATHEHLAHHKVKRIHKDPRHTELWCFKWGAQWYRDLFPIRPLPIVAFLPSLLYAVDTTHPHDSMVTVDYVPMYHGAVLIPALKEHTKTFPILTPEETKKLYDLAAQYEPKNFSLDLQQEKIEEYLKRAKAYLKEKRAEERKIRKSRLAYKIITVKS